ncbi:hypothetical protein BU24DRAFT_468979 [Aaosphaeria arxii CBS 175.79]|uniref:Uncharacterized protein n=1 Tax=Aaosphaeria arxii CBS 175.79 TaxID=1450172 RepID=A0A6A5X6A8_9PLEO|nr:uncharacterized protein BU24DRAFT_468979 [Aaosphaeria arxii CBS 175.79]KAF2008377.1 hypothetical protein BU24DRAFT_468979 [Aaosphaeria arxii CBS 175.79]
MAHRETELLFHSDTNTPRNSSESTTIEVYKEEKRLGANNQHQSNLSKLWTFSILSLAVYSVVVTVLLLRVELASRRISCQPWRASDLEAAHSAIDVVEKKFTTGIRSFQNGTLYRSYDPSEPTFVGPPSPEIDANWDNIVNLDTQAFYVMPEEATSLPGQPYRFNRSGVYEVE